MMNEPLSSIMTTEIVTAEEDARLSKIKDILDKHQKIHHVPIVKGKKLVGILTTHDILRFKNNRINFNKTRAKDVMTKKLAVLTPNNKVGAAAELFLENLFHAVPIIDEKKNLLGIVTSFDVLKYSFKKEYPKKMK